MLNNVSKRELQDMLECEKEKVDTLLDAIHKLLTIRYDSSESENMLIKQEAEVRLVRRQCVAMERKILRIESLLSDKSKLLNEYYRAISYYELAKRMTGCPDGMDFQKFILMMQKGDPITMKVAESNRSSMTSEDATG